MTVALMAQRHHRKRSTTLASIALLTAVFIGGITSARSVQFELASAVQAALGSTVEPVEIVVDGLDVTLRTNMVLTDAQRAAVVSITHLGSLTIVGAP